MFTLFSVWFGLMLTYAKWPYSIVYNQNFHNYPTFVYILVLVWKSSSIFNDLVRTFALQPIYLTLFTSGVFFLKFSTKKHSWILNSLIFCCRNALLCCKKVFYVLFIIIPFVEIFKGGAGFEGEKKQLRINGTRYNGAT